MQRYIDLNRTVVDPFLDPVAGASLEAGNEGGVVDEAIEAAARGTRPRLWCCVRHIGAVRCHVDLQVRI